MTINISLEQLKMHQATELALPLGWLFNMVTRSQFGVCVYLLPYDETCRAKTTSMDKFLRWNEHDERKLTKDYHLFNILHTNWRRNSHSRWIHRLQFTSTKDGKSISLNERYVRRFVMVLISSCSLSPSFLSISFRPILSPLWEGALSYFFAFVFDTRTKVSGNKWRLSQLKFSPFIWKIVAILKQSIHAPYIYIHRSFPIYWHPL